MLRHSDISRRIPNAPAVVVIALGVLAGTGLIGAGEAPLPFRFVDVASERGLTTRTVFGGAGKQAYILESTGTGAVIFDFDGDGNQDVFVANGTDLDLKSTPKPSQLYRNDGTGHFRDVASAAGLTKTGWAQAACAGDLDNDGHPDLFVTYYGQNVLYRNLGNGRFEDATAAAGMLRPEKNIWNSGCALLDFDRDGLLDIVVASYVSFDIATAPKPGSGRDCLWKGLAVWCGPHGMEGGLPTLYRNNGDGTFTDVSAKAGLHAAGRRNGLGVVTADFDNDGWPDIYIACDQTASLLFRNKHDGTFEEIGSQAGVAYNADGRLQAGMGVAVADYEGTGFLAIAKTNFSGDRPSLFRNENGSFFEDVSEQAGLGRNQLLGWGIAFLDIDEDGWPDLVMANGHVYPEVDGSPVGESYRQKTLLYRNSGNGRFEDVTSSAGPGFATARPSRGLAVGDLDGDGRPEVVIVNMNERPSLLKNVGRHGNALAVELEGRRSNRSAIGARITVTAGGRKRMAEVVGGGSYYSQSSLTQYIGLGGLAGVERIEVRWPNGQTQAWGGVGANRTVHLTEGRAEFTQNEFARMRMDAAR
jgi:hypothetical protein